MRIKLVDQNIKHIHNYSGYDTSEHFEWYKGGDYCDIAVFTDHMLEFASQIDAKYKVAWVLEPPCINPRHWNVMKDSRHRNDFNRILTYSTECIEKWGAKAMWFPGGGSQMYKKEWQVYPKSKNILLVTSHKKYTTGHKLRWEIVDKLKGFDIAGWGSENPFPERGRAETYAPYRYQIYVQNMIMEDMWGDRLIDCFLTGTIPIVWGGHFLSKYFNKRGFWTFDTIEDLQQILFHFQHYGEARYKEALPAINDNFEIMTISK